MIRIAPDALKVPPPRKVQVPPRLKFPAKVVCCAVAADVRPSQHNNASQNVASRIIEPGNWDMTRLASFLWRILAGSRATLAGSRV